MVVGCSTAAVIALSMGKMNAWLAEMIAAVA
jgi:hypothetical protein